MKQKAKRIDNGEWVEGSYIEGTKWLVTGCADSSDEYWQPESWYKIDPSTLCQQVRGTELFEGDEVHSRTHDLTGVLSYSNNTFMWRVRYGEESFPLDMVDDWKPTGRNKHDL